MDKVTEIAKAGAEMALSLKYPKMSRYGWAKLDAFFDVLEIGTVEKCHSIYEASGKNAVCNFVSDFLGEKDPAIVWGYCPACEDTCPTYPGDGGGRICLVCWSVPSECDKCHSHGFEDDLSCTECGVKLEVA